MYPQNFSNVMPFTRLVSSLGVDHTSLVKLLIVCCLIGLSTSQVSPETVPPSHQTIGSHRSSCLSSSGEQATAGGNIRIMQPCSPSFICYNSSCVCPLGHAYHERAYEIISSRHRYSSFCAPFDTFTCTDDVQCQDIDLNVFCNNVTQKCHCRRGYKRTNQGFCVKSQNFLRDSDNKHLTESFLKSWQIKYELSIATPAPTIEQFKTTPFYADQSCNDNRDCDGEYVYCSHGICKCWPEFHFVIAPSGVRPNTIDDKSDNQSIKKHETIPSGSYPPVGQCIRKLCDTDDECQTEDNPNLVCNNTICECRYGYIMYRESKTCMRYVIKRQSCDLTCRIIGGLFATIFMLTLIYWCCYCCYSIVKNYRNYRSHCAIVSESNGNNVYGRNNRRRHNSGETSFSGRLTASVSNFLRAQIVDEPPSYVQAMADEMLPDYDAALENERLNNKCLDHDDSTSVTVQCQLTLDGTDDCQTNTRDQCPNASQQDTTVYDDNKRDNAHKMSY